MLRKPKGLIFRLISAFLIFFFMASFVFPKESLAYRSRDGGGEIAEFDFGKWALGTAAGMVSSALGSAVASGLKSAYDFGSISAFMSPASFLSEGQLYQGGFIESISSLSGVNTWATNFVNSAAVGQVQNAVGAVGSYYGWNPGSTILISSIAGGIVGGGLAPGHFGSSLGSGVGVSQIFNGASSISAFEGMGIGLLEGALEGAILMSAADKKGRIDPIMGNVANLTGSLLTGVLVGGLTSQEIDYFKEPPSKFGVFSFGNAGNFDFSQAAQSGMRAVLRSLPSAGLSIGVQSITRGMDKQDAYIVKNAFSGAYYMVNMPTGYLVDKAIIPAMFGKEPTTQIKYMESPLLKQTIDQNPKVPTTQNYNQINEQKYNKSYLKQ